MRIASDSCWTSEFLCLAQVKASSKQNYINLFHEYYSSEQDSKIFALIKVSL